MSPPGLQNCQSGPQHPSWNALAMEKPITHFFFTYLPTGAAEYWFLGVRTVLERWRPLPATAHSLRSASGLSLLGSAEFIALAFHGASSQPRSPLGVQPHQLCFTLLLPPPRRVSVSSLCLHSGKDLALSVILSWISPVVPPFCVCVKCTDLFHYRIIFTCSFMKISLTGCLFTHLSRTAQLVALWLEW